MKNEEEKNKRRAIFYSSKGIPKIKKVIYLEEIHILKELRLKNNIIQVLICF